MKLTDLLFALVFTTLIFIILVSSVLVHGYWMLFALERFDIEWATYPILVAVYLLIFSILCFLMGGEEDENT